MLLKIGAINRFYVRLHFLAHGLQFSLRFAPNGAVQAPHEGAWFMFRTWSGRPVGAGIPVGLWQDQHRSIGAQCAQ